MPKSAPSSAVRPAVGGAVRRRPGAAVPAALLGAMAAGVSCPVASAAPDAPPGRVIEAVSTVTLQRESSDPTSGRYDWGAVVMRDGDLHRMWWVRLGGGREKRFAYAATLPDGERFEFTYPDWGDRIYCAESRDGRAWKLDGRDFAGAPDAYRPGDDPLLVLRPSETAQERYHVACPSVIKVAGTFYMYYEAPCEFAVTRGDDGKPRVGGEYHNQVFVATSGDGRSWRKHPSDEAPRAILPAPDSNKAPGARRYGFGQPSACFKDGRYILHYVDSCTGPGDFIVRIEADNPFFRNARPFGRRLAPSGGAKGIPAGAVARFAQTDVRFRGDRFCLVRPAYGTGRLGLLASRTGVFAQDADAVHPREVFPQIRVEDARGAAFDGRHAPRFLTGPHGDVLAEKGRIVLFYGTGKEAKEECATWDLQRSEVPAAALEE